MPPVQTNTFSVRVIKPSSSDAPSTAMIATRSRGQIKTITTTGSERRTETKHHLAVHVKAIKNTNPNVDVNPVENPFIGYSLYLAPTKLETIFWGYWRYD